ncbi:MAG: hypothetical protein ACK481_02710 [Candidatus Melainabacteria bacterium]
MSLLKVLETVVSRPRPVGARRYKIRPRSSKEPAGSGIQIAIKPPSIISVPLKI